MSMESKSIDREEKVVCLEKDLQYPLWKYSAFGYLDEMELWSFCDPDLEQRVAPPASTAAEYASFRKRERKATRELFKSLASRYQSLVLEHRTIVNFWDALINHFEGTNGTENIITATEKLVTKCEESSNVVEHISQMNIAFSMLVNLKIELPEIFKIALLYATMPSYCSDTKKLLEETKNESYTHACNQMTSTYRDH